MLHKENFLKITQHMIGQHFSNNVIYEWYVPRIGFLWSKSELVTIPVWSRLPSESDEAEIL